MARRGKPLSQLVPDLMKAMEGLSVTLANDIKTRVEQTTPRDSGFAATQWDTIKEGDSVKVVNKTDYLDKPELGTATQPAQLFTKRAVDITVAIKRNIN